MIFCFMRSANPRPCPLLDVTDPGSYRTTLAENADLRTDLPLYRIWQNDELTDEVTDGTALWAVHPDLVTFLIDCSFTFEWPLMEAGIEVHHITDKSTMCRCIRQTASAARLKGELVVFMRPDRLAALPMRLSFPATFRQCMAHRCISVTRRQSVFRML